VEDYHADPANTDTLFASYRELIRIEQHWTDQVQNQQHRIAAVLAVNGFLLAFLAATVFTNTDALAGSWVEYPFLLSLVLLSSGLVFGILTLWPQIRIAGTRGETPSEQDSHPRIQWLRTHFTVQSATADDMPLWLNAGALWNEVGAKGTLDRALLNRLCASVAANADGNVKHSSTLNRRRALMHWEIGCVMAGLLMLTVAVVALGIRIAT
jgi:hypothetical protein